MKDGGGMKERWRRYERINHHLEGHLRTEVGNKNANRQGRRLRRDRRGECQETKRRDVEGKERNINAT